MSFFFLIGSTYVLLCGLYLDLLVLAARRYRSQQEAPAPTTPFAILIPAHNEAASIAQTIGRLAAVDYPRHLLRCVVIADNCDDETAPRAAAAGAEVWVRTDPGRYGKGAALRWAFDRLVPWEPGQGVGVLDADSVPSPNWLRRGDAYLRGGARAVQSYYTIANESASWRARLLAAALVLFHHVRPAGREVLGWSAGLKGNGMLFARDLLERVPWAAYSVTEDLEYASCLALAGVRVAYDGGSHVLGLAGVGEGTRTQRLRWEGGRFGVLRRFVGPLLLQGFRTRSLLPVDAAMELLVLPLGLLALLAVALVAASAGAAAAGWTSPLWVVVAGAAVALLAAHIFGGLWAARAPARFYGALALAPAYLSWKILLYIALLFGAQRDRWVRTDRAAEAGPDPHPASEPPRPRT